VDKIKKELSNHLREIERLEGDTTKTREALEAVKKDDKERRQTIQRLQKEIDDAAKYLGQRPDKPDASDVNIRIVSQALITRCE